MNLVYRMAQPKDLDEIWSIVSESTADMTKQNILQWDETYPLYSDFARDIERQQLTVGLDGESIAVLYCVNRECDEEYQAGDWQRQEAPFYVLHRLCVNPAFQNRGIARQTLSHIENELIKIDIHAIRLDVFGNNPYAIQLYQRAGYRKVGEVYWRPGRFDLMEKYF